MAYLFSQIANIFHQEIKNGDIIIQNFAFDSRMFIANIAHTLFIALKTESNDGHHYIEEMRKKGVPFFLIDNPKYVQSDTILVNNVLEALQKLASLKRKTYPKITIGITGSNGKTMVKDALECILSQTDKAYYCNPRSYNSQLGVALSLLEMPENTQIGIFEAGISKPGEMKAIERMICPTIGILTFMGDAHQENFINLEEKITEKLQLFSHASRIIISRLNPYYTDIKACLKKYPILKIIEIDYKDAPYIIAVNDHSVKINDCNFILNYNAEVYINNVIYAIVAAMELGIAENKIQDGIAQWNGSSNRLSLMPGIFDSLIVNDSYTNDMAAMQAAIQFTNRNADKRNKTAIISGLQSQNMADNQKIIGALCASDFNRIYTIGSGFENNKTHQNYGSVIDFIAQNNLVDFENNIILIKGQRNLRLEQIGYWLQHKKTITHLAIRLDLLKENFTYYRTKVSPNTKIMVMIKAGAYGNGAEGIAKFLTTIKPDYLAVAQIDEGIALRNMGIKAPIMVLYSTLQDIALMAKYKLAAVVYDLEMLAQLISLNIEIPEIHIELDTGMHRLGFLPEQTPALCAMLSIAKHLNIVGIMSHLSSADDKTKDTFTQLQINLFNAQCAEIENVLEYKVIKHIANTAGIIRFKNAHLDMVRLGIGIYGFDDQTNLVKPVAQFNTQIMQIKNIPANQGIGYGNKEATSSSRKIAILPVGYADGFDRGLGNGQWKVAINGRLCPTAGNICMDMCMIDVSQVHCQVGDAAILFGHNNTVTQMAKVLNTINYEVITRIADRVKRIYISEQ